MAILAKQRTTLKGIQAPELPMGLAELVDLPYHFNSGSAHSSSCSFIFTSDEFKVIL